MFNNASPPLPWSAMNVADPGSGAALDTTRGIEWGGILMCFLYFVIKLFMTWISSYNLISRLDSGNLTWEDLYRRLQCI